MRLCRSAGSVRAAGSPVPARLFTADAAAAPGTSAAEETGGAPGPSWGEEGPEAWREDAGTDMGFASG
ncbi:hypothetical protein BKH15_02870 [Actinomyces oris]|uniref:Uncharacterized protein n=1 Tax=Actinomyces oris TaxID=544580 RepID=A0A1Q8XFU8_9ACTO|nr:hypothetical protein BKH15_02870 [Actinomyces oris]